MSKTIVAIVVVAILVIAGAGAAFVLASNGKDNTSSANPAEINFITGLEAVGSGVFYDKNKVTASDLFADDILTADGLSVREDVTVKYKAAGWNKLIIGTPTATAIQQIQIKTIVEQYLNDASKVVDTPREYKYVSWQEGQKLEDGEVYFVLYGTGTSDAILAHTYDNVDLGITWQPNFSKVVADSRYTSLVRTNELFPHQTCCVTIANAKFVQENPEVAERVVWAIVQGTNWLNAAKAAGESNPNDVNYQALLNIGRVVGGDTFTKEDLIVPFNDVEYAWSDNDANPNAERNSPLDTLKSDVVQQVEDLYNGRAISNNYSDLGFSSWADYADSLVDDTVLRNIINNGVDNVPAWTDEATVKFKLISGDIHQLPVHIAATLLPGQTQTFFEQAGIDFQEAGIRATGSGQVVTTLHAGEADFAVSGQPGVLIDNINNKFTVKD
ncbi:MAG: hypothetical protein LBJ20_01060 [Candidatus Methanoplasma sp.]|jgi:ABC-type nitrate/sulfonate/bicarbonate transport system substrate-binding protein|nr:hypothetical protein [Candidatus Methanoplasma sp.]